MDPSILGIVLGVMGVSVAWWLLTAGPWSARRQRRRARELQRQILEQQYAKRTGVRSSDDG